MVQTCYICKWRADKVPRRSFHKFPYDEAEKQKWLDIIGKSNVSLGKRTSVCSIHFDKTCFRYGLVNGRELLRQGSVPSIQLTRPPEVDPYEELYNMHEVTVDVKVEPHSDNDSTQGIDPTPHTEDNVADTSSRAGESLHQKIKAVNQENVQEPTSHKSITIEVPQTSFMKTVSKAKSRQNGGRIVKMDVSKRKDFLKKLALVRMLMERLRRDHIKLKNHIQSLEERQKTCTKKRRKKIEVTIELNGDE